MPKVIKKQISVMHECFLWQYSISSKTPWRKDSNQRAFEIGKLWAFVDVKQKSLDERRREPFQPVIFKENGPRLDFPRNFTAFARPDLVF